MRWNERESSSLREAALPEVRLQEAVPRVVEVRLQAAVVQAALRTVEVLPPAARTAALRIADLSIEAGFDAESDAKFLCAYLERKAEPADYRHFLAEKLYVDYLWTLWAKTRLPYDGQPMEDWASERYARLKKNIQAFQEI